MTDTTTPETNTPAKTEEPKVPEKLVPMEAMRVNLNRLEAEFACALPPQIPTQKFIRTTMTAIQMNPNLLSADRRSVFAACMKAAQDGLLVDGREAALVIFGKQVQYMPMIGGLLKKLRNSGELASIAAHIAYDGDEFRYELGDEERIVHRPQLGEDRGKPMAAYAIAKTKDGAIYREVMSVNEIEAVRSVSRSGSKGPWVQWWDEMARKTVLRRLMKRLPSSADVDQVVAHDNETNDLAPQAGAEQPIVASPSRLRASMGVDDATDAEIVEPADEPEGERIIGGDADGEETHG